MTIVREFRRLKADGKKVTVVTSYDYWSARLLQQTKIDGILVGDCSSMVMHGNDTTLDCDVQTIEIHTRAVARGAPTKFIISAMPFMAYRKGFGAAMTNVERLIRAGARAVKIEGVDGNERLIAHLTESGIPVVGHIGLTPSHHYYLGGFKVQGKTPEAQEKIIVDARKLESLGCFAIVLEAVPPEVGAAASSATTIPVIGVGAGPHVDGQGLVLQDLLGLSIDFKPKFVRTYLDGAKLIQSAVDDFVADVAQGHFPGPRECYSSRPPAPPDPGVPDARQSFELRPVISGINGHLREPLEPGFVGAE